MNCLYSLPSRIFLNGIFLSGILNNEVHLQKSTPIRTWLSHALLSLLTIAAYAPSAAAIDQNQCNEVYATNVVEFDQGQRQNGNRIPPNVSDPSRALGEPEDSPNLNYVALGFGGTLTLGFINPIINVDGDDFEVIENTPPGQDDCDRTPEQATVEVSQDGVNFVTLGTACLDGSFDLGSLQWVAFVRLTDVSDPDFSGFQPSDDGYDVDGIRATGCDGEPVFPILHCVSTDGDGDGVPDEDVDGNPIYTARFGYNNGNDTSVDIPIGDLNGFNPDPEDRGQPTTFSVGLNEDVFSVEFDGDPITWAVYFPVGGSSQSVTASADSPRCDGDPTPTPTPTPTPSPSPSPSPSPGPSPTTTPTPTPTPATPTPTATPTATPTPTPTPAERVRPVLECVRDSGNGEFTALFGYQNDNDFVVEIPVGSSSQGTNSFRPGTDQGQPTIFQPGRNYGVFEVVSTSNRLVWTLQYQDTRAGTATASADSSACTGLTPSRLCVLQGADGTFRGIFGYQNSEPFPIEIEVGKRNRFRPAPRYRGQDTLFLTGNHPVSFAARFEEDEERIRYVLDGQKVGANILRRRQRCFDPPTLTCGISDPISTECAGETTEVTVRGSVGYDPNPEFVRPQIDYTWELDCDDPNATIEDTDTLTTTVTLRSPGEESSPGSGVGSPANCTVTLTANNGDPLVDEAICQTTIDVDACIIDCDGLPDGPGVPDECGICNGDNSTCEDCNGIPNGPGVPDECGVCDGDGSSCQPDECPDGEELDRCGVCGGLGFSCLDCELVISSDAQFEMDQEAHIQRDLVFEAAALLREFNTGNPADEFATDSEDRADELLFENWRISTEELTALNLICGNDVFCRQDDTNENLVEEYNANADELRDVGTRTVRRATRAPAEKKKKLQKQINRALENALEASSKIPPYTSICDE